MTATGKAASLCAGIGGLDLALEALGCNIAWHAEYDDAPSRVLAHRWPGVLNVGDITTADWSTCEPGSPPATRASPSAPPDAGKERMLGHRLMPRAAALKAIGNAVQPQTAVVALAQLIGRHLERQAVPA